MMKVEEYFKKARSEGGALYDSMYEGKSILFFAITDWVENGHRLAQSLGFGVSARYQVLSVMGSGTPQIPCDLGYDVYKFFLFNFQPRLPEDLLLVYPEHKLVPKQQRELVAAILKNEGTKRIVVITTSPVILTDALRSCVFIVNDDCFKNKRVIPRESPLDLKAEAILLNAKP